MGGHHTRPVFLENKVGFAFVLFFCLFCFCADFHHLLLFGSVPELSHVC